MALSLATEPMPLAAGTDGVVRITGTRVTLDTVVTAFQDGASAEEIVHQYPSLRLADVYAVIGYYLRHRTEIEEYLRGRRKQAGEIRKENESHFDPQNVRDRLLARRSESKPR